MRSAGKHRCVASPSHTHLQQQPVLWGRFSFERHQIFSIQKRLISKFEVSHFKTDTPPNPLPQGDPRRPLPPAALRGTPQGPTSTVALCRRGRWAVSTLPLAGEMLSEENLAPRGMNLAPPGVICCAIIGETPTIGLPQSFKIFHPSRISPRVFSTSYFEAFRSYSLQLKNLRLNCRNQ